MTPDAGRVERRSEVHGSSRPPSSRGSSAGDRKDEDSLAELSGVTGKYRQAHGPTRRPPHGVSLLLPAVAAVLVASLAFVANRPESLSAATFRIAGEGRSDEQLPFSDHLLRFAATRLAGPGAVSAGQPRWFVDSPAEDLLRVVVLSRDVGPGADLASEIATAFLQQVEEEAAAVRDTPAEAERIVAGRVDELTARLEAAGEQMDEVVASMPAGDPSTQHAAVLEKWRALRAEFAAAREELAVATADFAELRSEPEPTHGVVTADERREAVASDLGLQQDLRELAVTLSELKSHMVGVYRGTGPRLELLVSAADGLHLTTSDQDTAQLDKGTAARVDAVVAEALEYGELLAEFAKSWSAEFHLLQKVHIDPQSGEILDFYFQTRSLLNDFLFTSAKHLTAMRGEINRIGENQTDHARYHVLHSDLVRAFQTLQGAHHRFEFSAGGIETPDNFRIDAALRSASGLRRRSQDRMRVIENRLNEVAVRRARELHAEAIARTQRLLDRTRGKTDQTVDQLVALQDKLTATVGMSEEFAVAVVRAELARNRLQQARRDLDDARLERDDLARARLASRDYPSIELVSAGVIDPAVNRVERSCLAGSAGVITFLSVLLGQWTVLRRKS